MIAIKTPVTTLVALILCFSLSSCDRDEPQTTGDTQAAPEHSHAERTPTPATTAAQPYEGWETFSKDKYSIRYPADWTLKESGTGMVNFFIFSPKESPDDGFIENVNLVTEVADMSLDDYIEATEQALPQFAPDYRKVEGETVNNTAGEYYRMISSFTLNKLLIKNEQYFWIHEGQAYVLTFSSTPEDFERHRAIGERIMGSFRLN
jgi:hypothetical protein